MEGRGYEKLVALYLRLNGYFILENFILHSEKSGQITEVDVFGVRFPYEREEFERGRPVRNDPKLVADGNATTDVIIAEVTSGPPHIHPKWKEEGVFEYILRFVGFTDKEAKVSEVAECLRRRYHAEYGNFSFRIVAFGQGDALHEAEEGLETFKLQDILDFVRKRFYRFIRQKRAYQPQWDSSTLQGYLLGELGKGRRISLPDVKKWGQSIRFEANAQLS